MTDDPTPTGSAPPRRRRWLPIALAVSVCLNLLVAGAVAGMAWRFADHPHGPAMPAGFDGVTLWKVFRHLPEDGREAARDILRDYRPQFREIRQARDRSREAIAAALEAEPFRPEALAGALAAAREAERGGRALVDEAFARFAGGLSGDTRREIAEELRERRGRRHWKRD